MAIIDSKLEFADALLVSAASGSHVLGTNEIYLGTFYSDWLKELGTSSGAVSPDIGEGNNGLVVNFQVNTAVEASCRIVAKVYSHTASGVTSGTELGEVTFAAGAVAGSKKSFRLPAGTINKWLGVDFSVSGSSTVAAKMDAWLGLDTETPSS
jgi:hypothetical protein